MNNYILYVSVGIFGMVLGSGLTVKFLSRQLYNRLDGYIKFLSTTKFGPDTIYDQYENAQYVKGKIDAYTNFRDSLNILM